MSPSVAERSRGITMRTLQDASKETTGENKDAIEVGA